ncbi:MAG: excinuclease ABC subunit UvrC [Hyphomicrobiaceae bacterium]
MPAPSSTETAAATPPSGWQVIAEALKTAPSGPGVYRMYGKDGTCLYVGKARSVRKRVASYARPVGHSARISRMIMATYAMEFVTTRTESEALLLEANLIKRLKPRFNVLLRDDKSFPYILIARDHDAPQILKHRGARNRKGDYFGPFASAGAVDRTINTLQRAFLLRTCSDGTYATRTRPCMLYQIKRCSGPCTGEIGLEDYGRLVDEAVAFLKGDSQALRSKLQAQMVEAADRLAFEQAARFRNRLQAISHVQAHQGINPEGIAEADVFAVHQEGGQTCIQVFFFRTGQNWGNRPYFPRADRSLTSAEVLDAFIAQFYDDKPAPRLIMLSEPIETAEILAEALSIKSGHKVEILVPQRGEKRDLVLHAEANAREALGRRMAESSSQRRLLQGLAATFGLPHTPRRIEVYDNSHIMGSDAIGAMIVAGPDGFVKGQYRKFNMRTADLAPGDDYAMMTEMLTRRLARLIKEEPRSEVPAEPPSADGEASEDDAQLELPAWPDLLLIDGGKGQLAAALAVLDGLGIHDLPVIGVAKGPDRDAGREHFHSPGQEPRMLEPRDPVLYFVQRLRDEAHRFAIGSHRARRKRSLGINPLDEIAGIGPRRKQALLKHFGSAKAVSRAGVADLLAVEGISEAMARTIYGHFHDGEN